MSVSLCPVAIVSLLAPFLSTELLLVPPIVLVYRSPKMYRRQRSMLAIYILIVKNDKFI